MKVKVKGIKSDLVDTADIVSFYHIFDTSKLGVNNIVCFPGYTTNGGGTGALCCLYVNDDNFETLDFDDNTDLTRLVNKIYRINQGYVILKELGHDTSSNIIGELSKCIRHANDLLTKADKKVE